MNGKQHLETIAAANLATCGYLSIIFEQSRLGRPLLDDEAKAIFAGGVNAAKDCKAYLDPNARLVDTAPPMTWKQRFLMALTILLVRRK